MWSLHPCCSASPVLLVAECLSLLSRCCRVVAEPRCCHVDVSARPRGSLLAVFSAHASGECFLWTGVSGVLGFGRKLGSLLRFTTGCGSATTVLSLASRFTCANCSCRFMRRASDRCWFYALSTEHFSGTMLLKLQRKMVVLAPFRCTLTSSGNSGPRRGVGVPRH